MRNLELLRSFPCLELAGVNGSFCFTVDSESGVVYTANSLAVTGFQPSCQQVSPLKHGCYPEGVFWFTILCALFVIVGPILLILIENKYYYYIV